MAQDARYDRPYWTRNDKTIDRFDLTEPEFLACRGGGRAFTATIALRSATTAFSVERPVQYRYPGPWVGGEKQKQVSVLPLVSVTLSPGVIVFPTSADDKTRPISVNALYKGTEPAEGTLSLEVPSGWTVEPGRSGPRLRARERSRVDTLSHHAPKASRADLSRQSDRTFERRSVSRRRPDDRLRSHPTRYLYHPAEATVQALDLAIAPVSVGYVMGVGDEIPTAIRQLGAKLAMLTTEDLARATFRDMTSS